MSAVSGNPTSVTRLRLAVASLVVLLGVALPAAVPAAATASSTIAADSFTRTIATGWASADTGGSYTYDPSNGAFSTDGAVGRITLSKAQANRAAYLSAPQARDVDMTVRVAYDKLPAAGGAWAYLAARRNGNNEYRPKMIINASGALTVQAGVVVGGSESGVGPAAATGLTPVAGSYIWLRAQVTGASPTTIQVKAWADGTTEPAGWQFTGTNSNAALQSAGAVGIRSYVSSVTNAPIVASFDDLSVASLDAPPPPVASFTSAQETGTFIVDFSDTSSGAIDTWAWDFGDGTTDTAQSPSHAYASDGDYSVSLTVTGPSGSDSETMTVSVEPLSPPPTVLLSDDFERPGVALWGTAPVGGVYSYQNRLPDFTTDGSTGAITMPSANTTRGVFALSTVAGDVDISFAVSVDKPAAGAATWIYAAVRRTTDGYSYRPKIRLAPNGAVYAHASRVTSSGEKALGPEVLVPGLTQAANAVLRVHAQAIGANPTTVRVRVWADGTPEPDTWQFTATDSTPALQLPGALGVLAFVNGGATNVPLTIHFDDLLATTANPVHRVQGVPLTGAGDIAACNSQGDEQTARLVNMIQGDVFTVGDNAYPNGTTSDFANCYNPSWGAFKDRTHPAPGNHEYNTSGAAPYYAYFGAAAGDPTKGYYAFDEGTWRIYVLNGNCGVVACQAGSAQEQWLRNDIATNPSACSLAIIHQPRWSSGSEHGSNSFVQPLWQALYDNGVEMLLSGHDHDYERFAPMNGSGALDQALGVRQFVVGTGGANHDGLGPTPLPTTEVRQSAAFGVLNLVLGDGEYEWDFIPVAGQLFSDRGSGTCH